jgi:hypothetical protein
MQPRDHSPDTMPDEAAGVLPADKPAPTPPPAGGNPLPAQAGNLWRAALIAGLVGGVSAALIGEVTYKYFKPVLVSTVINGIEGRNATLDTIDDATVLNAMLTFGMLGAILGVVLGASAGLARRSGRDAAIAATVGLLAGGVAGVGAAAAVLPTALRTSNFQEDDLLRPFLVHSAVWVPLGVAAGLAFGIGAGRRGTSLLAAALGGGLGAMLGTGAFELIGGLAFPFAQTDRAFSQTAETRMIARLCVALGVAAGAAMGGTAAVRRRASPSPS